MATIADPLRFAKRQDTLYGEMDSFTRELGNGFESAKIRYELTGISDNPGVFGLQLDIEGEVSAQCQRCLESMSWPIEIKKFFRLVPKDKFSADMDDDELDEEGLDLLEMGKSLDVESLIEEMLVLEWPVSPKHDDCELFTHNSTL